jgi:hypothetical protein
MFAYYYLYIGIPSKKGEERGGGGKENECRSGKSGRAKQKKVKGDVKREGS